MAAARVIVEKKTLLEVLGGLRMSDAAQERREYETRHSLALTCQFLLQKLESRGRRLLSSSLDFTFFVSLLHLTCTTLVTLPNALKVSPANYSLRPSRAPLRLTD
jgi:hypothetical protein